MKQFLDTMIEVSTDNKSSKSQNGLEAVASNLKLKIFLANGKKHKVLIHCSAGDDDAPI